jgi:LAGLIDADG endonuclease
MNPQRRYYASRTKDLFSVVIPFFEAFPLRAKKHNDFLIWKEGVALLMEVWKRKRVVLGWQQGMMPKWTEDDIRRFDQMRIALENIREYVPDHVATFLTAPL